MSVPDVVALAAAALGTALATGLGVVPVVVLGARAEQVAPALTGVSAGVMVVAAITGLLRPALATGDVEAVLAGLVGGVAFYALARRALPARGWSSFGGQPGRRGALIFLVLLVHSLPEGFAVGSAWASTTAGLAPFVVAAIAWQNIPEGTSIAIPMRQAGASTPAMVAAAIGSSLPQPVGLWSPTAWSSRSAPCCRWPWPSPPPPCSRWWRATSPPSCGPGAAPGR